MKKFVSTILFLSVFLIQLHGLVHLESGDHTQNHHCAICEVISHTPGLNPPALDFQLEEPFIYEDLIGFTSPISFYSENVYSDCAPRAPPFI